MILNWLGNLLFGIREKTTVVVSLQHKTVNSINAIIEAHNAKHHEIDHITMDDFMDEACERFIRRTIRLDWEEHDFPPQPVPAPTPVQPRPVQSNIRTRVNERAAPRSQTIHSKGIRQG